MEGGARALVVAVGLNSQAGIIYTLLGAAQELGDDDDGDGGDDKKEEDEKENAKPDKTEAVAAAAKKEKDGDAEGVRMRTATNNGSNSNSSNNNDNTNNNKNLNAAPISSALTRARPRDMPSLFTISKCEIRVLIVITFKHKCLLVRVYHHFKTYGYS